MSSWKDLEDLPIDREKEYRRGYRDGFIQTINHVFGLERKKLLGKPDYIYEFLLRFWERDLLSWLQGDTSTVVFPPSPEEIKCSYCKVNIATVLDHIVPKSKGGTNDPDNLTPCCYDCNMSKRNKDLDDWLEERGFTF